ncbi:hypothetical protein SCHPADRAFT_944549 [Schizopora paradoxa]|uniref:UBC core domain-containing protein n=1 Tax=Schizopora paradoxa TaxID=27342 RepID=A0A0H2RFJ7_9AGAM|nr:hypothetical protein SCHPADRAFT_944549 [Schizopora paradoxa]
MNTSQSLNQLERKNGRPLYSLYRLQYDLAQLADDLPRGIRVVTNEADISNFCLILEPSEGYLEGCRIHLTITVPNDWPRAPLSARINTPFNHPNVFGGGYICCDILQGSGSGYSNYYGGYSPAYSLAGTFMQLASFFSGSSVEQEGGYNHNVGEYSARVARESLIRAGELFDCKVCVWKSLNSSPLNDVPMLSTDDNAQSGGTATGRALDTINDDVLLVVISFLDTPSLLIFGSVYDRVKKLLAATNEIARREVRCFVTKRDPRETILGVGLQYDKAYKAFTSTFDYISKFAFDDLGIRKDTTNRPIEFWLPLAIDGNHYAKASADIQERLVRLDTEARSRSTLTVQPQPQSGLGQDPIKQLVTMANALVVDFMKTCDAAEKPSSVPSYMMPTLKPVSSLLKASERAIAGYCSIIHLIASYALENPKVITDARQTILAFNASQAGRHKTVIPDLGQFMIRLCLVDDISWPDVRASVIQELFTRSVVWQLQPAPKGSGLPGLAYLEEDDVCEWRLAESFKSSRTGLRLCLFQIFFMEKLAKREGSSLVDLRDDFNGRRGLAPPGLTAELLERMQFIYKMDNLGTFAIESGRPETREGMTKFLRERIIESAQVGYHRSTADWPAERLIAYRRRDDVQFRLRHVPTNGMLHPTVASADDKPSFFPQERRNNDLNIPIGRGGRGAGGGGRGAGGGGRGAGGGRGTGGGRGGGGWRGTGGGRGAERGGRGYGRGNGRRGW